MTSVIEDAKRAAAREAVANHYPKNPRFVGIGSGTTIVYVVEAIKSLGFDTSSTSFVPTGSQSQQVIVNAGLKPVPLTELPEDPVLDIAFDGADEVDDDLNCIKGGGACLFQEKVVAMRAKEFIVVADYRKLQPRLLTKWPSIPIEIAPVAFHPVISTLKAMGSMSPVLRKSTIEEGFLRTDQSFFIVDAPFPRLLLPSDTQGNNNGNGKDGIWEVEALAKTIKQIPGVLEVGIFCGPTGPQAQATGGVGGQRPIAAYFGMADGTVVVKKAT
ncbi:ribose-5-phosphate isomerase rki1 [Ophidiomyces ophidiicola]|nr:ribose-5-phosphate isomerase rki1 [Ophidiomyces ophidiicola]KAI1929984.1 ribose-5-phosphate isomerase rki1 [Ophidiomyces ophidiicola]KAI2010725.1 ribose-5-phosphate isomerase rki1 [Ophidiomyces ophidiicola]KAI2076119.1 ribose-5-phosphate isomerase rki1 [Ophidiomyces ophidiicola]KAI2145877.1 ribose-5-phosphate isomerase rki1 [Ophidiomyces ophidiicola]